MNPSRPRLEPADLRAIQAQLSAPQWSAKLAALHRTEDETATAVGLGPVSFDSSAIGDGLGEVWRVEKTAGPR